MPKPIQIVDCMRRNPLTIQSNASLAKAVELLVDNKLTGLTVVDDQGLMCGILSELDCLKGVLSSLYNEGDPGLLPVSEVMTKSINSCGPLDNIVEVAQAMLETRQRRRPVIENGKLVGQVSCSNILWALMEHSRSGQSSDKGGKKK